MKRSHITIILFLNFISCNYAQIITSVAGQGGYYYNGYAGDNGPATSALLYEPNDVTFDKYGNMFIADQANNVIRKVNTSGIISTVAGTGISGYSGDGGPATLAQLSYPSSVVTDTTGNLYIADANNYVIRKVDTSGIITTFAGSNAAGNSGDGGPATQAAFDVNYLCIDKQQNIYLADFHNNVVRKINTSGIISAVAGTGGQGFSGDGGPATLAKLNYPTSVCADTAGNIYIGDNGNYRVRKINTAGVISTIAGTGVYANTGDGGPATSAALYSSAYIRVDKPGNVYICEGVGHRIRKIGTNGIINTLAGSNSYGYTINGGPALLATFMDPAGLAVDNANNLYVADMNNNVIRKITYCPAPMPPVHISGNPNFCGGSSETLSASGAASYTWSAGAGHATTATVSISPSVATTYYVASTNGGCIAFDSMTVNIFPVISIAGTTTVCAGDSTELIASGASTYTWSANAGGATTDSVKVSPAANIVYTVTATSSAGCRNTDSIALVVHPQPTVTFATIGFSSPVCVNAGPHIISGGSPSGGTYSGLGVTGHTFNPTGGDTGTIVLNYSYTNSNHCTGTATHTVLVNACNEIDTYVRENELLIYPNPAGDQFFISANTSDKLILDLYDINGRHVLNKIVNDKSFIALTDIDEGIYLLTVRNKDRTINKKIAIAR